MEWLFVKKHPDIIAAGKKLNFDDLAADSTVVSNLLVLELFLAPLFLFS